MRRAIVSAMAICCLLGCSKETEDDQHPILRAVDPELAEIADQYDELQALKTELGTIEARVQERQKEIEKIQARRDAFQRALTNEAAMAELSALIRKESASGLQGTGTSD